MAKYKRQGMATKRPEIPGIYYFTAGFLISCLLSFSIYFFVHNPSELVNFTDDYVEHTGVRG